MTGPTATDFFNKSGSENTAMVQEGELADPAVVARDGYNAMQSGQSKIISGWKNKIQAAMGNFMSDETMADVSKKQTNAAKRLLYDEIRQAS